jgi:hypothetical protein
MSDFPDYEVATPVLPGVDRPLTPPERGAKTAQMVLELIQLHPEMHNQQDWIIQPRDPRTTLCHSTLCVAGWAQWLHEGVVCDENADTAGARYLGLDEDDADLLFYSGNARALAALECVARGEKINWEVVYQNEQ